MILGFHPQASFPSNMLKVERSSILLMMFHFIKLFRTFKHKTAVCRVVLPVKVALSDVREEDIHTRRVFLQDLIRTNQEMVTGFMELYHINLSKLRFINLP